MSDDIVPVETIPDGKIAAVLKDPVEIFEDVMAEFLNNPKLDALELIAFFCFISLSKQERDEMNIRPEDHFGLEKLMIDFEKNPVETTKLFIQKHIGEMWPGDVKLRQYFIERHKLAAEVAKWQAEVHWNSLCLDESRRQFNYAKSLNIIDQKEKAMNRILDLIEQSKELKDRYQSALAALGPRPGRA